MARVVNFHRQLLARLCAALLWAAAGLAGQLKAIYEAEGGPEGEAGPEAEGGEAAPAEAAG